MGTRFFPRSIPAAALLAAGGAALVGCAAGGGSKSESRVVQPSVAATMIDTAGAPVGTASIVQTQFGGVLVLKLSRLAPGPHGLHVHANGACDPPSFTSAGPHLNPANRKHGLQNPEGPHLGDLPNITAGANGAVDTTITLGAALFKPDGIGGARRALVVHAGPDDMMTDPAGNSGGRIACGVLER
ncbi:MAG TPA: superoxide dismutase family protein [Gemmatimonadales bacterium]|nr:superoxide dismutase family protein [Gemmatimonadales bacterium]